MSSSERQINYEELDNFREHKPVISSKVPGLYNPGQESVPRLVRARRDNPNTQSMDALKLYSGPPGGPNTLAPSPWPFQMNGSGSMKAVGESTFRMNAKNILL